MKVKFYLKKLAFQKPIALVDFFKDGLRLLVFKSQSSKSTFLVITMKFLCKHIYKDGVNH